MEVKHIPVLKKEAIEALEITSGKVYIDATLGGGGYSLEMLNMAENSTLLSLDFDRKSIDVYLQDKNATKLNERTWKYSYGSNTGFVVEANFSEIESVTKGLELKSVDGIVADLGWSTDQLNRIEGLSFENEDAMLDMRFSSLLKVKASDILKIASVQALQDIFGNFGDVSRNQSKKLAEQIAKRKNIETVGDLLEVISNIDTSYKFKAQVFQSLRIAVNGEYDNLNNLVHGSVSILKEGGKLVVVTFHSGEDTILENAIEKYIESNQIKHVGPIKRPSVAELKINLKARSAKLFSYEKI